MREWNTFYHFCLLAILTTSLIAIWGLRLKCNFLKNNSQMDVAQIEFNSIILAMYNFNPGSKINSNFLTLLKSEKCSRKLVYLRDTNRFKGNWI